MADFEDALHKRGKQFTDWSRGIVKDKLDDPIEKMRQERAAAASQAQGMRAASGSTSRIDPRQMPMRPEVAGPAGIPQDIQDSRTSAMIAAAENISRIKEREAAQRGQYEAEDAMRAQEEASFDPSSYKEYKRPGQQEAGITAPQIGGLGQAQGEQGVMTDQDTARFQGLKAKMQAAQPQPQQGMIELSEDPEEQARQIAAARAGQ